ncbi:MAG: adenylate/guanylate cyclase domain-containing protein [Solirubrobacterales bacterium]|nr:adenylate/guanylate cyclase domain-containing protein [Solirubrobacterales bacterium]
MDAPEVRYARNGDVSIAYGVVGDGPFDLVFVAGWILTVFLSAWDGPAAETLGRLASFSRLILFDKRGTGLSDRSYGLPDYETRMDDIRAVMDAVGSRRAALRGVSEGGPLTLLFAATHPERAAATVLYATTSTFVGSDEYPWAPTQEQWRNLIENPPSDRFGTDEWFDTSLRGFSPSIADDPEMKRWWRRWVRESGSPGALAALRRINSRLDARHVLSSISTPTLVLHPVGDTDIAFAAGKYIADHLPGALLVELPGVDHGWWVRPAEIGDHTEQFLTDLWRRGEWDAVEVQRVLATVLFTDIVGSTAKLAELGDRRWRELLGEHDALVRRQLARFRGRELGTAGDGFFAAFDGPARAIRCACSIVAAVRGLGLEVRAGLHTGECEQLDGKVGGIAVHIGARVAAQAGPGEVIVSHTVKDLVAGSGIDFHERNSKVYQASGSCSPSPASTPRDSRGSTRA